MNPFKPFQNLYQHIKLADIKLFQTLDRISDNFVSLYAAVDEFTGGFETVDEVLYGAHAVRLKLLPRDQKDGILFVEVDRNGVTYQTQKVLSVPSWVYVFGIMKNTLVPDNRPTDLAANDNGFLYQTTDTKETYRWSGTAWINQTPLAESNFALTVVGATEYTLTTVQSDLPGLSINLTKPGKYLINFTISFSMLGAGDLNSVFLGYVVSGGVTISPAVVYRCPNLAGITNGGCSVSHCFPFTLATAPQVIKLQAYKTAGSGTSSANGTPTSLTATWLGS